MSKIERNRKWEKKKKKMILSNDLILSVRAMLRCGEGGVVNNISGIVTHAKRE